MMLKYDFGKSASQQCEEYLSKSLTVTYIKRIYVSKASVKSIIDY